MSLAVMQPYLFPYIGYYQLAYLSDIFVFYDDVNYIKNGYINRNEILTKNGRQLFTLPVNKASSFTPIKDLYFSDNIRKILAQITQAYSKAPYFNDVYPIVEKVFISKNRSVEYMTSMSIIEVFKYLNVDFNYFFSSALAYERQKSAEFKLFEMCKLFGSRKYVNSIGGSALYNKSNFLKEGVELLFLSSKECHYSQFNNDSVFQDNLSIIDVLMNNGKDSILELLANYELK
ncbi:WbqC family protein [Vibrio metschnikovii]|nr:WbqC family protein [Vibrio metschnikovii]EKO3604054.1 WbqC family protein [Vibrio metschnikovii]EKQ5811429.1 WbqC family protein [Vibrio metschnikovii]